MNLCNCHHHYHFQLAFIIISINIIIINLNIIIIIILLPLNIIIIIMMMIINIIINALLELFWSPMPKHYCSYFCPWKIPGQCWAWDSSHQSASIGAQPTINGHTRRSSHGSYRQEMVVKRLHTSVLINVLNNYKIYFD